MKAFLDAKSKGRLSSLNLSVLLKYSMCVLVDDWMLFSINSLNLKLIYAIRLPCKNLLKNRDLSKFQKFYIFLLNKKKTAMIESCIYFRFQLC